MRRILVLVCLAGCSGSSPDRSGVKEVDQTALFLKDVVTDLRKSKMMEKSDEIAAYLTSDSGKSLYWPPDPVYEKEAADYYRGRRPADNVAIWDSYYDIGSFDYYILVSSDAERNVVILDAYKVGEEEKFFTWEL
jgi:hypothetical protein